MLSRCYILNKCDGRKLGTSSVLTCFYCQLQRPLVSNSAGTVPHCCRGGSCQNVCLFQPQKVEALFGLLYQRAGVRSSAITARNACYLLNLGVIDENEVVYILLDFM